MDNTRFTRPSLQFLAAQRRPRALPELRARQYGFNQERRGLCSEKAARAGAWTGDIPLDASERPHAQILVLKRKRRVTH